MKTRFFIIIKATYSTGIEHVLRTLRLQLIITYNYLQTIENFNLFECAQESFQQCCNFHLFAINIK